MSVRLYIHTGIASWHMGYTVVSEIFAGRNFCKFCDEGRFRENLVVKFRMDRYKMTEEPAIFTFFVIKIDNNPQVKLPKMS